jgi:hypothetical protein
MAYVKPGRTNKAREILKRLVASGIRSGSEQELACNT